MNRQALYDSLLQRFESLKSPDDLFSKVKKPAVLFPIGIAGAGKSSALGRASQLGWKIINADEVRRQHLREIQSRQESIVLRGQKRIPDPNRPEDVFAPEIRAWLPDWILADLRQCLAAGQDVILDITNLTLERVRYLVEVQRSGHQSVALLFPSLDLGINAARVKGRGKRGGLDLVDPQDPLAEQKRLDIINQLDLNFWCYLESLSLAQGPQAHEQDLPNPSELRGIDFQRMKAHPGPLSSYLATLELQERAWVEKLIQADRFDRIFVVPAPSKSVPE